MFGACGGISSVPLLLYSKFYSFFILSIGCFSTVHNIPDTFILRYVTAVIVATHVAIIEFIGKSPSRKK